MVSKIEKVYFHDIPVSRISISELGNTIEETVRNGETIVIYGFSLHSIYSLRRIPEIIILGREADVIVTDGQPFYWLCNLHGLKIPESVSIPNSVNFAIQMAVEKSYSIMFLGAKQEVNERALNNLKTKYPEIILMPGIGGYFHESQSENIIKKINEYSPDILLVGMSSPKKERFVFLNRVKIDARVIIPCGGMIDVLAGVTKQTPKWMKKIGMASFFRVYQEPKRLLLDRIKMGFFIIGIFMPRILFNLFFTKKRLSLINLYCKKY